VARARPTVPLSQVESLKIGRFSCRFIDSRHAIAGNISVKSIIKAKHWDLFAPWPHAFCNACGFMMKWNVIAGSWFG